MVELVTPWGLSTSWYLTCYQEHTNKEIRVAPSRNAPRRDRLLILPAAAAVVVVCTWHASLLVPTKPGAFSSRAVQQSIEKRQYPHDCLAHSGCSYTRCHPPSKKDTTDRFHPTSLVVPVVGVMWLMISMVPCWLANDDGETQGRILWMIGLTEVIGHRETHTHTYRGRG